MSRKLPLVFLLFLLCGRDLLAQDRLVIDLPAEENSLVQRIALGEGPFYAFFVVAEAEWASLTLEHSTDGVRWSMAQELALDPHATDRSVSQWLSVPADVPFYRIRREGGGTLRLYWYNPGHTPPADRPAVAVADQASAVCPCPLPAVLSRTEWCPDGSCPNTGSPVSTEVTHLIVHHSAGTNDANDWAAIVRVIYELHVTGNGWDDIGYNYLIDPNGVVYAGRGNDIRGAHFCGSNTGTMGVCILGTFTSTTPTTASLASLASLLAWKSCDRDLDPLGSAYHAASELTLPRIAGHRQGCATACPGDAFYPLLPAVRQETAAEIAACQAVATPDAAPEAGWRVYPNPTVAWLTLEGDRPEIRAAAGLLVLFDTWGRRIRTWTEPEAGRSLYLGDLPAGVYQLRSLATGQTVTVVKR